MNDQLPYFRMYAAEFLADEDVSQYSDAQAGALLRLWCREWVNGTIPREPAKLARLLHYPDLESFKPIWDAIWNRFEEAPGAPDRLVSRRLELEREEATEARDQKVIAGRAGGIASGEARRKHHGSAAQAINGAPFERRSSTAREAGEAPGKPIQPASLPASQPSSPTSQPASQPSARARAKANGSELPGAPPPLDVGRLAGWKRKLGEALHLPGGIIAVGKQGQESEVLLFFQTQLERVGEENLLADCLDCASRSKTGTPSSLAWFVPWLRNLSLPPQGTEEA